MTLRPSTCPLDNLAHPIDCTRKHRPRFVALGDDLAYVAHRLLDWPVARVAQHLLDSTNDVPITTSSMASPVTSPSPANPSKTREPAATTPPWIVAFGPVPNETPVGDPWWNRISSGLTKEGGTM